MYIRHFYATLVTESKHCEYKKENISFISEPLAALYAYKKKNHKKSFFSKPDKHQVLSKEISKKNIKQLQSTSKPIQKYK